MRQHAPIPRHDIRRIHPRGTLQDFLAKHSRASGPLRAPDGKELALPADDATHKYAYTSHSVTCYGGEGNINAWDPYTEHSDEFSLGQVACARGSGNGFQTVEAGHQEFRNLTGDWFPHLFTFYTTNGYSAPGDNKMGYNRDVKGWVQYSRSIFPGALSSPLSSFGGAQYIMAVQYRLYKGNWWLRINGQWIGYYPATLFNQAGLRSQADKIDWYGEVAYPKNRGTTATSMGSGRFPSAGWQYAAFMSNMYYQSSTDGSISRYNGSASASNSKCYDVESHVDNTGSWQSYFWWGGPGRSKQCP